MAEIGIKLNNNSPLFEFPLGQCLVYFDGYLLGKTTADTIFKTDRDIKDILYSQDGTKPADWVATGELYSIDLTLGETKDELISVLDKSWVVDRDGNALLDRDLYESYRENRAKGLKLVKVDGNGQPLTDDIYQFNFWEAIPVVNGDIMQFGADTQKNFQVTFNMAYHVFSVGESATYYGGYGYIGDPTVLDVPAIVWPPIPQSFKRDIKILFNRDTLCRFFHMFGPFSHFFYCVSHMIVYTVYHEIICGSLFVVNVQNVSKILKILFCLF